MNQRIEGRKTRRYPCYGPIEFRVQDWYTFTGKILNLSLEGCFIQPDQPTGYVITNSRVTTSLEASTPPPDGAPGAASTAAAHNVTALGRPWRPYARVVFMNTELPAQMNLAGYTVWKRGDPEPPQAWYAEYNNSGPGWQPKQRPAWEHMLTAKEATAFEPQNFLKGSDHWNPITAAAKLP